MNRFLVIITVAICFFSCQNSPQEELLLKYKIETIEIPISPEQLNSYQIQSNYSLKRDNFLVSYNDKRLSLDFFNLDRGEVIVSKKLEFEAQTELEKLSPFMLIRQIPFSPMN